MQIKFKIFLIFCIGFFIVYENFLLFAQPVTFSSGLTSYSGYTLYQIGGFTNFDAQGGDQVILHFPLSELNFPINTVVPELHLSTFLTDRLFFNTSIAFSSGYLNNGTMKDSDWLEQQGQKDIYSESDTRLQQNNCSAEFYYLANTMPYAKNSFGNYYFGVCYEDEYLSFIASHLTQYSLSDPNTPPIQVDGDVLTYTRHSAIPYYAIKTEHFWPTAYIGQTKTDITLGFSPWVNLEDTDDHILRKKIAEGSLNGYSLRLEMQQTFWLTDQLVWHCSVLYRLIDAEGKQVQTRYEATDEGSKGMVADADERLYSETTSIFTNMQYFFEPVADNRNPMILDISRQALTNFLHIISGIGAESSLHYGYPYFAWELAFFNNFRFGLGYSKVNSKNTESISKGSTTQIPVYLTYYFPVFPFLNVALGGGYTFTDHKLDPQAVSDAAKQGFVNAKETLLSYPFGKVEICYILSDSLNLFTSYSAGKSNVVFTSNDYELKTAVVLSQWLLGVKFKCV